MVLKINYDKVANTITVDCDVETINVELNNNALVNNEDLLSMEIAVDTSEYEQLSELPEEEIIE